MRREPCKVGLALRHKERSSHLPQRSPRRRTRKQVRSVASRFQLRRLGGYPKQQVCHFSHFFANFGKIQVVVQASPDTGNGVAASHRGRPGAGEARRVPDVGGG